MRPLTGAEIGRLAGRPGVRRVAAENFLATLDEGIGAGGNLANLELDARLYGWSRATVKAIEDGIRMAFSNGKEK